MKFQVVGMGTNDGGINIIPENIEEAMSLLSLQSECSRNYIKTKVDTSWPDSKETCLRVVVKSDLAKSDSED